MSIKGIPILFYILIMVKYIKVTDKNGEELGFGPVSTEDVVSNLGLTVQNILDGVNDVQPSYTEGTTIATISGVDIKIPDGNIPVKGTQVFSSVSSLKNSTHSFALGEVVYTKGYRTPNDGGASYFIITNDSTIESDDATHINLANGLFAEIMPPANGVFNFYHFGAYEINESLDYDNSIALLKFVNYCKRVNHNYTLFIPGGVWIMSSTDIESTIGLKITGEIQTSSSANSCTRLKGMVGASLSYLLKISGTNIDIRNLNFGASSLVSRYGSESGFLTKTTIPTTSIILDGVNEGYFDGLYQTNGLTLLDLNNVTNCYFGFLNIRLAGSLTLNVMKFGDNISGVYFDYFNIEGITGTAFYGYGTDFTKPCQFVLNNLQMEGTHPKSGVNPGFDHNAPHYFVFAGHLGSKDYPCIINNISISNLGSYKAGYKCMAVIGHETDTELGMIIGNYFIYTNDSNNRWLFYDTSETNNAYLTVNQPVSATTNNFYITNGNLPLINTVLKRAGLVSVLDVGATKVSYKSGAYSSHRLVGMNDAEDPYYVFIFPNRKLGIRFYNSEGVSEINLTITPESEVGVYESDSVNQTLSCDSTVGWTQIVIPDLGYTYPRKIKITGLPKYIDYFIDYE